MSAVAEWRQVLDAFEAELDALDTAIDDEALEADALLSHGTTFQPPVVGPLPLELRDRAARVQRRMAEVEERLHCSLRSARRALVIASRMSTSHSTPPARFVDARF